MESFENKLSGIFNFVFKSLKWKKLLMQWGLIIFLFGVIFILGYIVVLIPLLFMRPFVLVAVLMGILYIFLIFLVILIAVYILGKRFNIYKQIKELDKIDVTLDDLDTGNSIKYFKEGVKLWIVDVIYMMPLLVFFVLWGVLLFLFGTFTTGTSFIDDVNAKASIFMIGYVVTFLVVMVVQNVYLYLYSCILKPILLDRMYKYGYRSGLNFRAVFKQFFNNFRYYLQNSVYIIIPYMIWFVVYMFCGVLTYLCIGAVLIPFVLGAMYIIIIYVEPYIAYLINRRD
jgi:hypothetical protein